MNNSKLTAKKLLVVLLTAVLLTVCISSSTFSWFDRPKSLPASGNANSLSLSVPYNDTDPNGSALSMKSYDGYKVTMKTYVSTDHGKHFSPNDADPATSGTLGTTESGTPSNRVYYKTTITNGSTSPQTVSLYIKDFNPGSTANTNVCVGTNVPVKSFKNYSANGVVTPPATKESTTGTTKRIYFDPTGHINSNIAGASGTIDNWNNGQYWVKSGISAIDQSTMMQRCTSTSTSPYYHYYYADIPENNKKMYITCQNSNPQSHERTQTFENLDQDGVSSSKSVLFYLNGQYNGYNNVLAKTESCKGASFGRWYSAVNIATEGQTIDVSLDPSDYAGTLTYSSSNTSLFTVSTSGVITSGNSASGATPPTLSYTVTSDFGDTKVVTANVIITNYRNSTTIADAPIVTNLLIPAATTEDTVNADFSNVQDVYWFIQNGDPTYGPATATASYTLAGIYIGL